MSLEERENQRKSNSVVGAMINGNDTDNSKEIIKQDTEILKARSYYLTEELYMGVNLKAALSGVDKSSIVRAALTVYLEDVLKTYRELLK